MAIRGLTCAKKALAPSMDAVGRAFFAGEGVSEV